MPIITLEQQGFFDKFDRLAQAFRDFRTNYDYYKKGGLQDRAFRKDDLEAQGLGTKNAISGAQLREAEFNTDPTRMQEQYDLTKQGKQSDITRADAQARQEAFKADKQQEAYDIQKQADQYDLQAKAADASQKSFAASTQQDRFEQEKARNQAQIDRYNRSGQPKQPTTTAPEGTLLKDDQGIPYARVMNGKAVAMTKADQDALKATQQPKPAAWTPYGGGTKESQVAYNDFIKNSSPEAASQVDALLGRVEASLAGASQMPLVGPAKAAIGFSAEKAAEADKKALQIAMQQVFKGSVTNNEMKTAAESLPSVGNWDTANKQIISGIRTAADIAKTEYGFINSWVNNGGTVSQARDILREYYNTPESKRFVYDDAGTPLKNEDGSFKTRKPMPIPQWVAKQRKAGAPDPLAAYSLESEQAPQATQAPSQPAEQPAEKPSAKLPKIGDKFYLPDGGLYERTQTGFRRVN